jgi:imidazolonepropionase-like amidohydrolase
MRIRRSSIPVVTVAVLGLACSSGPSEPAPGPAPAPASGAIAFVGATLIDGTGGPPVSDAVLVVSHGSIDAVGPASAVEVPPGVERIALDGRFVMPGLVNAHGHVGGTVGLESGPETYSEANVRRQVALYARYGVTTVMSLGDDQDAGFRVRDEQGSPDLDRARLYVAGPVITAETPEAARVAVDRVADLNPDFIKIRVDDNLGTTPKMTPEVFTAVIDEAHARQLRVAAHVYYLDDAKALLRAGADYLAHSIRDRRVDGELIELMKARDVCLSPTLTREVSTFVYGARPPFFDDPFFLREADPDVVHQLESPDRQAAIRADRAAQQYKRSLEVARQNVKALSDAGVRLAFGTDSGPPGRFQGYFEHLELEELVKAGLTPTQAIVAATGDAARCLGLADRLGTLKPGLAADFLVLDRNPLDDIANSRSIESVWIAGNRVPGRQ